MDFRTYHGPRVPEKNCSYEQNCLEKNFDSKHKNAATYHAIYEVKILLKKDDLRDKTLTLCRTL